MNCDDCLDLISLAGDECLPAMDRERLERHLVGCESCRAEVEAFARSRHALGRLAVPELSQAERERMVMAAMPEGMAVPAMRMPVVPHRRRWVAWVTHAAALLLGLLMAWPMVRARQGGAGSAAPRAVDSTTLATAAPPIREVIVEVPVEVRVEVPVEKIVERIVYRDRHVEHPLQARWDAQIHAAERLGQAGVLAFGALDGAFGALESRAREAEFLASQPVTAMVEPTGQPAGQATMRTMNQQRNRPFQPESTRANVEVRRQSGRVTLTTRGSLTEVVPVLIDTLETDDQAIVAAAFDRLQSIRADLGDEALELRVDPPERTRLGGIRGLLTSDDRRDAPPSPDDPTLWRDWWTRQQAASGLTLVATSI